MFFTFYYLLIEPTNEELVLDTARRIQEVTTMILNKSSDVNETVRQMFADSMQPVAQLMEHRDGGSMKARRRKSCKKRGQKSNRKKLNRKTRTKV